MRKPKFGSIDGWAHLLQVIVIAVVIGALLSGYGRGLFQPSVGAKLASWQVEPLTGTTRGRSSDELAGQVVLLNFWGTWCGPCRRELPHIAKLARRFSHIPDVAILAVSCGPGRDDDIELLRKQTQAYLKQSQTNLATYADRGGRTRAAIPGMRGYPCSIVLDGDGIIRGRWSGYRPGCELEMEQAISDLLCSGTKNRTRLSAAR